ncbi:MAG: pucL [Chloroflexi bacterium]|nr:pucL [Chloroflexota bacterium]
MTLAALNAADQADFTGAIGFVFEHSLWIASEAWKSRPFRDRDDLYRAMCAVLERASDDQKLSLIRAHPDLAGKLAVATGLTAESAREQASVGLDSLTPEEFAVFTRLNAAYKDRFGFPFIICVREHTRAGILAAFEKRIAHERHAEIRTALDEVTKIARLRLLDAVSSD